jgi:hypothetical protein
VEVPKDIGHTTSVSLTLKTVIGSNEVTNILFSRIIVGIKTKLDWIILIKHFGTVFFSLIPRKIPFYFCLYILTFTLYVKQVLSHIIVDYDWLLRLVAM